MSNAKRAALAAARVILLQVALICGITSCNFQESTNVTGTPQALLQASSSGGSSPTMSSADLTLSLFTVASLSIAPGASTTLIWNVANATSVSIDNGIGAVSAGQGSAEVTPSQTTTYTLTATGTIGGQGVTLSRAVSVVVVMSELPAANLIFLTNPANGPAGSALAPFSVGALDANGQPTAFPAGSTCTLSLSYNSSGGTLGGTYQGVPATNGQAVFSQVTLSQAGTYTLVAACTGVANPSTASSTFVIAAAASNLNVVYTSIPYISNWVSSGESVIVLFQINDSTGKPVSGGNVTASVSPGATATLGGSTTVPIVGGYATFPNLFVQTMLSGIYTITFSSGSASLPIQIAVSVPVGPLIPSLPAVTKVFSLTTVGSTLYATTDQGVVASSDNGTTFSIVLPPGSLGPAYSVYIANGVYYSLPISPVTNGPTLTITANGTTTIPTFPVDTYPSAVAVSGGKIYVATNLGLYSSTDGGATFTANPNANQNIMGMAISNTGTIYLATYSAGVYVSTDGGQTFSANTQGLASTEVSSIWAINNVVFASDGGVLSRSTDGGNTFTAASFSQNVAITDVILVNGIVYARNANVGVPRLWASTDGGATFAPNPTYGGNDVLGGQCDGSCMANLGNTLFVADPNAGLLCRSTDGVQTFQCSL